MLGGGQASSAGVSGGLPGEALVCRGWVGADARQRETRCGKWTY